MALYKRIECKEGVVLGVWKIEETLDTLLSFYPNDKEILQLSESNINNQRLIEKIAVRVLLHTMLPNENISIAYEQSGKPVLNNGKYGVSISHTKGFVAVIIAPVQNSVGIDIEPVSDRTIKVAKRFMGTEEFLELMDNADSAVSTICWSAKEALYKVIGSPVADFRKTIRILPFPLAESGTLIARVLFDATLQYTMNYLILDNVVLVWIQTYGTIC